MRGRLFVTSSWLFHGVYNLHEEQSRPARRTPAAARIFRRRKCRPRSPSRSDQRTWCHLSELSLGFMSTCRRHFIFPLRLTFYHLWAFSKTEKDLQHSNVKNYFPVTVVMRASEPSNRVDFIAMRGATWIGPRPVLLPQAIPALPWKTLLTPLMCSGELPRVFGFRSGALFSFLVP